LSIIIPVYNEQDTVLKLLERLVSTPALLTGSLQFVVVNDGSTDGTAALLKSSRFSRDPRFVWLAHQKNLGKGAAIRTGLKSALGSYTVIQDGDLEYDPNDIANLLTYARAKNLPVVYGSRNLNPSNSRGGFLFYWGGRSLTFITNILFGQKLTDEPTCYKLFLTKFLKSLPLTCDGFEFCPEATALAARAGVKIQELPINYHPRGVRQGKKIKWIDWFVAVWTLLRLRVYTKKNWLIAAGLFVFAGLLYMSTWQNLFMGYERETAQSAVNMFSGTYQVFRAGPGAAIMYLPFVALGKLFYSKNLLNFLTIVPVFYSAATVVVLYFIACRLTAKKSAALLTVVLTAAASLIWPYSRIGMEYQATLWLCLLLLALLVWRKNLNAPVATGAVLAFLVFTQSYGIIFALPALIFIGMELWQKGRLKRLLNPGFLAALFGPAVLAMLAGIILNYIILGRASGAYNLAQEFQVWSWWEGFFGTFFSAGKSILLYSPLLIAALWYWKKFWQRDSAAAGFVLTSFLLLLLLTAPFSFWSDETLSVRKLMPVLPLLHLPLIFAFEEAHWKKLKKLVFALLIAAALYFQLINSLYPYWYGLVMLRPYNLDNLSSIRYSPRLSALALDNRLFLSYLHKLRTGSSESFTYQERSWMRCCTGQPAGDPFMVNMKINLAAFDRPEIYLVKSAGHNKKIFLLTLDAAGLLLSGGFLAANIASRRREETLWR